MLRKNDPTARIRRRHHNTYGKTTIRSGKAASQVERMAERLGLKYEEPSWKKKKNEEDCPN